MLLSSPVRVRGRSARISLGATLAASVITLLCLPGLPASAQSAHAGASPYGTALQSGVGESAAAAIAASVEKNAEAVDPNTYAGEVLTDNGQKVTVYLTRLSPTEEAQVTAGIPADTVSFARAPRSRSQLESLHQQVTSQQAALKAQGIDIVTWGPNLITGQEDLTVQNLNSADTTTLDSAFGSSNITLSSTTSSYTAIASASADRDDDFSPWNGGDFILDNPVTGECTSGFGTSLGTSSFEITAGHCYSKGAEIVNGDPTLSGPSYGLMGNVSDTGTFGEADGLDAELINTSSAGGSSPVIFVGPSTDAVQDDVSGTMDSPEGEQMCDSGAFEGEICGLVVQNSMSECITEDDDGTDEAICDVFEADNPSGGIAVGSGDSGGPVFRLIGSDVYATGIITASGGTITTCPTYQIPGFGTRMCGSVLYYTGISLVLSLFGVSLNTSTLRDSGDAKGALHGAARSSGGRSGCSGGGCLSDGPYGSQ